MHRKILVRRGNSAREGFIVEEKWNLVRVLFENDVLEWVDPKYIEDI